MSDVALMQYNSLLVILKFQLILNFIQLFVVNMNSNAVQN